MNFSRAETRYLILRLGSHTAGSVELGLVSVNYDQHNRIAGPAWSTVAGCEHCGLVYRCFFVHSLVSLYEMHSARLESVGEGRAGREINFAFYFLNAQCWRDCILPSSSAPRKANVWTNCSFIGCIYFAQSFATINVWPTPKGLEDPHCMHASQGALHGVCWAAAQ